MNNAETSALDNICAIYEGSDGEATRALYAILEQLGSHGVVAANLFRAQKNSERAKVYRGRGYRGAAYDRKQWSIDNLVAVLSTADAGPGGFTWGWGEDVTQPVHKAVLYIDLPTGQVSFHTPTRGEGPDYPGAWDGMPHQSPSRICRWVAQLTTELRCG